jgi:aryl-alcohol dehydrogenase-like predicted oxidoreductase
MNHRLLGSTGVEVSRLILGCGNFGGIGSAPEFFGQGESDSEAAAIMDRAWELGITTFDTADAYGGGRSEAAIGKWLRARGLQPTLTTKTSYPMGAGEDQGLAPARVRRQLASSLERLGVERVDLYLAHEPDPHVPLGETLDALDELVASGKVGAYGGSQVDATVLHEAAGRYRWVQNSYSLLERGDEVEVLPLCAAQGLGYTPFSPLAGGWLAGRYRRGEPAPAGSRMTLRPGPYEHLRRDGVWDGLEALEARAADAGVEMATLALAWLLSDPLVTAVIVGPRRPEQLEPAVRALELELRGAERAELAALFV